MTTLHEEIYLFKDWILKEGREVFFEETFRHTSESAEYARFSYEDHLAAIAAHGPVLCSPRVRTLVKAARERGSSGPIPSDEAMAALCSGKPYVALAADMSAPQ